MVEDGSSQNLKQPHVKQEEHNSKPVVCFQDQKADQNQQLAPHIQNTQSSCDLDILIFQYTSIIKN